WSHPRRGREPTTAGLRAMRHAGSLILCIALPSCCLHIAVGRTELEPLVPSARPACTSTAESSGQVDPETSGITRKDPIGCCRRPHHDRRCFTEAHLLREDPRAPGGPGPPRPPDGQLRLADRQ